MLLKNLVNFAIAEHLADKKINNITHDSRTVEAGTVFVCFKGINSDGHTYAKQALKSGAEAIICERDLKLPNQIIVKDARAVYATMWANYYDNPQNKLKLIGITGTCGKTSVSWILRQILQQNGKPAGVIGTISNIVEDKVYSSNLTTPDPKELYKLFSENVKSGVDTVIMEVSSQALVEGRVNGLHFDLAVFTNLSQDHLDFHKTIEEYAKAKSILFTMCDKAIINIDDKYGKQLLQNIGCEVVTYSINSTSGDFRAHNVTLHASGVDFELVGFGVIGRVKFAIPGEFSVYNALAAAGAAISLGVHFAGAIDVLSNIDTIKGRMELVETNRDFSVIIDFAHTPDEIEKACSTLKNGAVGRLITVFGCGGDRDSSKRPIMGRLATKHSDITIITSDNPRTEDPEVIVQDIIAGLDKSVKNYKAIVDRTKAIEYALSVAKENDIVLIAGKGHETYQIIGKEKFHYDEREIVEQALSKL